MPPQAQGEDMEVPFISCRFCCVHVGTGAMAPPGAEKVTPKSPSAVGPREDQLYYGNTERQEGTFRYRWVSSVLAIVSFGFSARPSSSTVFNPPKHNKKE